MHRIVKELVSEDGRRKVVIFERPDGTYGFQPELFAEDEQAWCPQRGFSIPYLPDLATAVREARGRVEWLREQASRPHVLLEPDARQITEIIDRDLREHPDFFNSHGVDLAKCRVAPTRITCADSFNDNQPVELWLVLREVPDSDAGYLVVFDAGHGRFGLATAADPLPVLLGWDGSFTQALAGM